jgi:hypothetical protein
VAQLGARLDGIEEVVGSNPIGSTNFGFYFQPLTTISKGQYGAEPLGDNPIGSTNLASSFQSDSKPLKGR